MNSIRSQMRIESISLKFYWLEWAIGTVIAFLISLLWLEIGEPPDLGTIQGTFGGIMIGSAQTLILSRWLPQAWLWMLTTLIAWGLIAGSQLGAIGWVAPRTDSLIIRLLVGALLGAITGLWLGVWQWLVLRQKLTGSQWWIVINIVSWMIGLSFGWLIGGILRSLTHWFLGDVIGLAIAWLLIGIQTGLGLTYLLEKHFIRQKYF